MAKVLRSFTPRRSRCYFRGRGNADERGSIPPVLLAWTRDFTPAGRDAKLHVLHGFDGYVLCA